MQGQMSKAGARVYLNGKIAGDMSGDDLAGMGLGFNVFGIDIVKINGSTEAWISERNQVEGEVEAFAQEALRLARGEANDG